MNPTPRKITQRCARVRSGWNTTQQINRRAGRGETIARQIERTLDAALPTKVAN